MTYRYRLTDAQTEKLLSGHSYFTKDEVAQIEIEPCDDPDKMFEGDWWCVHMYGSISDVPVYCVDDADARKYLSYALNGSIFERIHNL